MARASIRQHLIPWLEEVGEKIGSSDLTEIVNFLLNLQRQGTPVPNEMTTLQAQENERSLVDDLAGLLN